MASKVEDYTWKLERDFAKQLGAIVNDEASVEPFERALARRIDGDCYVAKLAGGDLTAWIAMDRPIAIAAAGLLFEKPRNAIEEQVGKGELDDDDIDAVGEVVNQLCSTVNDAVQSVTEESPHFAFTQGSASGAEQVDEDGVVCVQASVELGGAKGLVYVVIPRDLLLDPETTDDYELEHGGGPQSADGDDSGMSLTPEEMAAIREATRAGAATGKTLLVVPLSRDRDGWSTLLAEAEFDYDFAPDIVGLTRALRTGDYVSVVVDADACPSGGLPALTLVREAGAGAVPAVVVASSPTRTHLLSCVAAGAAGYLTKPIEAGLLAETLGSLAVR